MQNIGGGNSLVGRCSGTLCFMMLVRYVPFLKFACPGFLSAFQIHSDKDKIRKLKVPKQGSMVLQNFRYNSNIQINFRNMLGHYPEHVFILREAERDVPVLAQDCR